jgi:hypothetical protein
VGDQVSHPYRTGKIIVHISCPLGYIYIGLGKSSRYSEIRKKKT